MATGLDAGPHQLTLTDANGCAQQASVSVVENPVIELTDTAVTSAGVPPYIWLWSNGESTLSLSGLQGPERSATSASSAVGAGR